MKNTKNIFFNLEPLFNNKDAHIYVLCVCVGASVYTQREQRMEYGKTVQEIFYVAIQKACVSLNFSILKFQIMKTDMNCASREKISGERIFWLLAQKIFGIAAHIPYV